MKKCLLFLFAFCFIFNACHKEDPDINNAPSAWISMYAVAEDAPQLNIFLNGANVAASLPFGSYTLYNRVSPGSTEMRAQSYSRDINIDTGFSVSENKYYSLFLTGTTTSITPVLVHDSFPSLKLDSVGLRFFVFSSGVQNIDLHILNSDSTINKVAWANRGYGENITLDAINTFTRFPSGTYSFFAIDKTNVKDTLARFTGKMFTDLSNYTLMLEGHFATGDTTLQLGTRLH